jgi:hypothetical protein
MKINICAAGILFYYLQQPTSRSCQNQNTLDDAGSNIEIISKGY